MQAGLHGVCHGNSEDRLTFIYQCIILQKPPQRNLQIKGRHARLMPLFWGEYDFAVAYLYPS